MHRNHRADELQRCRKWHDLHRLKKHCSMHREIERLPEEKGATVEIDKVQTSDACIGKAARHIKR